MSPFLVLLCSFFVTFEIQTALKIFTVKGGRLLLDLEFLRTFKKTQSHETMRSWLALLCGYGLQIRAIVRRDISARSGIFQDIF
jgi:hypothetical protein